MRGGAARASGGQDCAVQRGGVAAAHAHAHAHAHVHLPGSPHVSTMGMAPAWRASHRRYDSGFTPHGTSAYLPLAFGQLAAFVQLARNMCAFGQLARNMCAFGQLARNMCAAPASSECTASATTPLASVLTSVLLSPPRAVRLRRAKRRASTSYCVPLVLDLDGRSDGTQRHGADGC